MYEFWYDYLKLKYGEKLKLCYIDTNGFIVKTLQKMLKLDLIFQIVNYIDHYLKEKIIKYLDQ